jgi:beta-1,4-mannooligosaccharide/beta-1,4-mannosyl-N-acetylglucosamine phosphorylase
VLFHAVDIDTSRAWGRWKEWCQRYTVGVVLLDLDDPTRVLGMSNGPVFVPEDAYPYESEGYRPYVLFPCGLIQEEDRSVKIFYGASDNVIALAESSVDELLALIDPV